MGIGKFLNARIIVFGMSFSGSWQGPKLFTHLVIETFKPYVLWYDNANMSAAAFEAE